MKKVILSLLCLIGLMAAASNVALADQSQYKKLKISEGRKTYKGLDLPKDTVTKFSRLTWSTNMVEWLWFAPNMGLEIDLKDPTLISCPSIFFQFSYRPGKETFLDRQNFDTNALYYWRARAEYRWHFRLNERYEQRRGLAKTAMWADEKFFTKKIETYVPDTAAIAAGDEYATRLEMSKDARIKQKIDSTCASTNGKKPELFPGRYYLGVYGEYANLTFNNDMLPIFGTNLKNGPLYTVGLSGGYDFPGFNYNHKCFLQWSVGASVGVFWYNYDEYNSNSVRRPEKAVPVATKQNKILPFITELKVALNFRNSTITNKYWQPDPAVYVKNIAKNHEDSIHMAELDSVLEQNPVVLDVTSVNGFDSAFVETVDKLMIVNAFKRATGLTYLLPTDFNMLEHVESAINNKELSDNYFIEYVTTNRLRSYTDSVFISDRKNLPFRLQIAGREEADSLKKSFVDSLKSYFAANDARPIFYGEPATKDSLKGFISKDTIAAVFSRIWGHPLDTSMIRTLYTVRTETEDDGTSTTYYDSVITEQQINRKERYAMFLQFHPQVTLSGEDEGVGRFTVAMAGADRARELFVKTGEFFNKLAKAGTMVRIQRPWNGSGDTFSNRVTKEEVYAALKNYGLDSVPEDVISIPDSIYAYNDNQRRDTINFDFGVTENQLNLPFIVDDSVGRARAQALWNDTIRPWREEEYWNTRMGLYDDDPKVPGYLDTLTGEWFATTENFINAVKDIIFADLKPYMVDSLIYRVGANPMRTGQYVGKYRAQARLIFHREMKNSRGEYFSTTIPYLLVPTETKEDAGWVPPVDSAAILKAQADSIFALTHDIITRDSVAYVFDSLGNVLDSTIIQITDTISTVVNDSLVAQAGGMRGMFGDSAAVAEAVDTVRIITVEEATEISNTAAALAKQTAAESKAATAAAKKAKSAAAKAQKTAAANIKKAEKSVKLPETMKVTRDSIVAQLDSVGQPLVDSLGNAVVDTLKIEEEVPFEMDSITTALVATRDSIIAAEQAAADSAVQYADSLQSIADQAKIAADEAKAAAAEAKKGIAEAKKAAKERAAAEKQKAKEEAAAAKAAAKAEAEAAKETVVESAAAVSDNTSNNIPTPQAAPLRNNFGTVAEQTEELVAENKAMTVAEATEASNAAAALAKEAAAESKAAAAEAKKANADAAKAAKAAAAALKKVPATAEGEEPTEEVIVAQQAADSLQNVANVAQQFADSLQTVADAAVQKMNDTKAAAAEAKKAIAEAKKAEKAAAAAAKQKAKEEAAAAKAAAKAEAEAAKQAAKEEAEAAKAEAENKAEEATAAVTEIVTEAAETATEAVAAAAEEAEMTEAEKKAAAKAAAAEAKKKAKEEAAAAKAAAKAEAAAKKAAAAEAKQKAKEEAAAAKAAAKTEAEAAKAAAEGEANGESTETKE